MDGLNWLLGKKCCNGLQWQGNLGIGACIHSGSASLGLWLIDCYCILCFVQAPLKLLSAMKGSREKEGLSAGKLTVKWAPDVYDPPVTLMSHTVKGNKQQKSRNKKNWKRDGKKGQRSNASRGKDKKQYRKGGASERCHRSLDARETIADTNDEFGDLVVGSREPHSYCGSSFLKNSLSNMHYPVAEAL